MKLEGNGCLHVNWDGIVTLKSGSDEVVDWFSDFSLQRLAKLLTYGESGIVEGLTINNLNNGIVAVSGTSFELRAVLCQFDVVDAIYFGQKLKEALRAY